MHKELIVGGGCFWCIEAVFEIVNGVIDVESGYANGDTLNPTYKEICTGNTGHAEVVKISYNPKIISLDILLDIFFTIHNPTTLNFQGADYGTQYRSCIFYSDKTILQEATNAKQRAQQNYQNKIVTQIEQLKSYYKAEDYHQDYYRKNPTQGYCVATIPPKINKMKNYFDSSL